MEQVQLGVQEALEYARDSAYWEGFTAGVQVAVDHAKYLLIQKAVRPKPPVQPQAPPQEK